MLSERAGHQRAASETLQSSQVALPSLDGATEQLRANRVRCGGALQRDQALDLRPVAQRHAQQPALQGCRLAISPRGSERQTWYHYTCMIT